MRSQVIDFVQNALERGERVALVTLSGSQGSVPGKQGCLMAVSADGSIAGTVGGGAMEHILIKRCREAIVSGEDFKFEYDLSDAGGTGMVCGGRCEGFAHILGEMSRLIIYGGGHIGKNLCELGKIAGFGLTVVDERDLPGPFAGARYVKKLPDDALEELNIGPDCYVVIVTHGHVQDYAALRSVIGSPAAYIGMIGSAKKIEAVYKKLLDNGATQRQLARVYSPIGLDIADGTPGEIAIAIMAQVLAVKNGRNPVHRNGAK